MTYDEHARRDTPLARKLKARIAASGPLPVADYMTACLQDAEHGYYRTKAVIGAKADFITAPEISQVFGELVGLWCGVVWQQMGAPRRFNLIEVGPGRGTMMRDVLRAAATVSGFRDAVSVFLIEPSERLREIQRETLHGMPVTHLGAFEHTSGPTIVLANEVLDCIAIAQHQHTADATWRPRLVGLDSASRLQFMLGNPVELYSGSEATLPTARPGDIFERRSSRDIIAGIAAPAKHAPVAALLIDYGHATTGYGDTLQAVRNHAYEHPLTSPGEADLTAQVDFAAFADDVRAANREAGAVQLSVEGRTTQAEFLGRLGIVERASRLMAANPARAGEIEAGVARLIAPNGMGTRFKAIGLRSSTLPPLPGFGT